MTQLACSRQAKLHLKLKLQVGPECGNYVIGPEEMPILVLGRHKRPQLKWDQPKTYKFGQSPHFQTQCCSRWIILVLVFMVKVRIKLSQLPPKLKLNFKLSLAKIVVVSNHCMCVLNVCEKV